ncbi:hypothetical protein Tco_1245812 [Tanacetum coccineum]
MKFHVDYDIPFEFKVMLSKSTQTMYDALKGIVGLYVHFFTLSNLRIPLPKFVCEAYGGEHTVDLFRRFLNLSPIEDWLTFAKRSEAEALCQCLDLSRSHSLSCCLKSSWKHNPLQPMMYVNGKADDEEMSFLPKEPSNEFGAGSPSTSINKEDLFVDAEPKSTANPEQLIENSVES